MSETKTFRQAAEDAYREAQAAARAADMVRARLDGEALTRVLREEWGLDVTVETSPAIVDGVLLRCISMVGEDPEISAALQCVMCGRPRWYQLHTGLADIGRLLQDPDLREYAPSSDPFELADGPKCGCPRYGAEPATGELTAQPDGAWLHIGQNRQWAWVPRDTIENVDVWNDGSLTIETPREVYTITASDAPSVLAALGIPEPPAPRPAVSPAPDTRDHAVVSSDAPACDYCGWPLPRRAIAAGATLCSAICARSQAEGQPSVWERGQAA